MRRKTKPIDTMMRGGYTPPRKPPPPSHGGGARVRILWHRVFGLLLMLGALVLVAVMITRQLNYRAARQEYAGYAAPPEETPAVVAALPAQPPTPVPQIEQEVALPVATPAPTASPTPTDEPFYSEKVRGLQKQNADTVGYIDVPGTGVQYPVVQGQDNEYYMTHSFAKKNRAAGAIFLDAWNDGFGDFNTILYGHNMKDGSMFSALREYRHSEFLREHKYIEVTALHSKQTYKVFAAYVAEEGFDFRGFSCLSQKDRAAFIKRVSYASEINTNTSATAEDRLLTLVTCTSGERDRHWIVHAVLVEEVTTQQ